MTDTQAKTAIIYVFSGTGNTLIAAQKTAAALFERGIRTDVYRIVSADSDLYRTAFFQQDENGNLVAGCAETLMDSKVLRSFAEDDAESADNIEKTKVLISEEFGHVPDPNSYDLAGFAYPIHAFNSPQYFLRFVKHLPELSEDKKGMHAFLFKTSGEPFKPNASSSYTLAHFLKKKGFVPGIDMHMLMPYNIMFRYPKEMAKQMYLHTETMSDKIADMAVQETYPALKFNPFITLFSYILRLQWFGAWINGPLHMVKKADCVSCGLCEKVCPSANIRMIGYTSKQEPDIVRQIPKMGWKCTMCMECTMGCPKSAINPGFLTPWKVTPKWDFPALLADDAIASNWTDSPKAGYFRFFRKYYKRTEEEKPEMPVITEQPIRKPVPVTEPETEAFLENQDSLEFEEMIGVEDHFGFDEAFSFEESSNLLGK